MVSTWNRRLTILSACPSFLLAASPSLALESGEKAYRCTPEVKYECAADRCDRITSDFQQAEIFSYHPASGEISACLWTNCYAAKAAVFADEASDTFTAIGRLTPIAHPGSEPVVVSLTIGSSEASGNRSFVAAWGYRGKGLTLDLGECVYAGDDQAR